MLRLTEGTIVDLFDDAGQAASGSIVTTTGDVVVRIQSVTPPPANRLKLIVASAVPKANRADWMIEKLAEIGVDVFIPLAAARSVVLPEGRGKLDRWERLSAEATKQSRRIGVMAIEPLTDVDEVVKKLPAGGVAWCLSTESGSIAMTTAIASIRDARPTSLTLFIESRRWLDDRRTRGVCQCQRHRGPHDRQRAAASKRRRWLVLRLWRRWANDVRVQSAGHEPTALSAIPTASTAVYATAVPATLFVGWRHRPASRRSSGRRSLAFVLAGLMLVLAGCLGLISRYRLTSYRPSRANN